MTTQSTTAIQVRSMDEPDESRTPDRTRMDVVRLGDATVARLTAQPGWSWQECIKPIAGTESCQAPHLGYVVSGRLHLVADDGTEADIGPGDSYRVAPGHHAHVVGDEPFTALEFEQSTAETYATS